MIVRGASGIQLCNIASEDSLSSSSGPPSAPWPLMSSSLLVIVTDITLCSVLTLNSGLQGEGRGWMTALGVRGKGWNAAVCHQRVYLGWPTLSRPLLTSSAVLRATAAAEEHDQVNQAGSWCQALLKRPLQEMWSHPDSPLQAWDKTLDDSLLNYSPCILGTLY